MPKNKKETALHYLMRVAEIFQSRIIIKVRNFSADPNDRFCAEIEHLEIVVPGGFQSLLGNGRTPYEALEKYRECVKGKVLVTHPNQPNEVRTIVESGE